MTKKTIVLFNSPPKQKHNLASLLNIQPKSIAQIDEIKESILTRNDSAINYFNGLIQLLRGQIIEIKADNSEIKNEHNLMKIKSNSMELRLNEFEAKMETRLTSIESTIKLVDKKLSSLSEEINELKKIEQEQYFRNPLNAIQDNEIKKVSRQHKKQQIKRIPNSKSSLKRSLVLPDTQLNESNDDAEYDDDNLLFILK